MLYGFMLARWAPVISPTVSGSQGSVNADHIGTLEDLLQRAHGHAWITVDIRIVRNEIYPSPQPLNSWRPIIP
jgi:hypothetical protein